MQLRSIYRTITESRPFFRSPRGRRYLVQLLGTSSNIRYSSHASRLFLFFAMRRPASVFFSVIRIHDFRRHSRRKKMKENKRASTKFQKQETQLHFTILANYSNRLRNTIASFFPFFFDLFLNQEPNFCQV